MAEKKIPKWVAKYISEWRERLYLHEWEVQTFLSATPSEDGTGAVRANVELYPDISLAWITFRDDIPIDPAKAEAEDIREWKRTILHELLHIRLARVTEPVLSDMVVDLAPSTAMLAERWFRRSVEPTIDLLAQVLMELSEDGQD